MFETSIFGWANQGGAEDMFELFGGCRYLQRSIFGGNSHDIARIHQKSDMKSCSDLHPSQKVVFKCL